jgi:hypothetical protein
MGKPTAPGVAADDTPLSSTWCLPSYRPPVSSVCPEQEVQILSGSGAGAVDGVSWAVWRDSLGTAAINHNDYVDELLRDTDDDADVGNIRTPDFVDLADCAVAQQTRIVPLARSWQTQAWLRIECLQPHELYQSSNPLGIDSGSLLPQPGCHALDPIKGRPGVLFVQETHHGQILRRLSTGLVIPTGTHQPYQSTLSAMLSSGWEGAISARRSISGSGPFAASPPPS